MLQLTERFEAALIYSFQLHKNQQRKATGIPYFSHIMSTTALVIENGGDEDEAIAALLHDAVEDQGGKPRLVEIQKMFGETVASIVDGCSDAYGTPKAPWRERKEDFLAKIANANTKIRRVCLADKLHNARSFLESLKMEGEFTWNKFNGGMEGTLWYYQSFVDIFNATGKDAMTNEFTRLIGEIKSLSGD